MDTRADRRFSTIAIVGVLGLLLAIWWSASVDLAPFDLIDPPTESSWCEATPSYYSPRDYEVDSGYLIANCRYGVYELALDTGRVVTVFGDTPRGPVRPIARDDDGSWLAEGSKGRLVRIGDGEISETSIWLEEIGVWGVVRDRGEWSAAGVLRVYRWRDGDERASVTRWRAVGVGDLDRAVGPWWNEGRWWLLLKESDAERRTLDTLLAISERGERRTLPRNQWPAGVARHGGPESRCWLRGENLNALLCIDPTPADVVAETTWLLTGDNSYRFRRTPIGYHLSNEEGRSLLIASRDELVLQLDERGNLLIISMQTPRVRLVSPALDVIRDIHLDVPLYRMTGERVR